MRRLLERNIAAIDDRLVLLAPPSRSIPSTFLNVQTDNARWQSLVHEVQRLRGSAYLRDGALRSLSDDGRHETPEDDRSWHILRLDAEQRVTACIWYMEHDERVSIEDLRVHDCPLIQEERWRDHVHSAVSHELSRAEMRGVPYAEVGGWAVASGACSAAGVLLALSAYSLGRLFGGSLVMATATVRHASSTILRRLGGSLFEWNGLEVPAYFDPRYACDMELLRFDTQSTHPKYDGVINTLAATMANAMVFTPAAASLSLEAEAAAA